MLQTLLHILLVLIMINCVIIVHELGHYAAARFFKIKVNTLAIGFGKVVWHNTTRNINLQLSMFPLGGYVSMFDSRDNNIPSAQHPYCLDTQRAWKKIVVYLAGPAINIICAIMVYWALLTTGISYVVPEIGAVIPHSIAAQAMLPSNTLITKINDNPITSWKDANIALTSSLGSTDSITLETITATYKLNTTSWKIDTLNFDPITSLGIEPYEPDTAALIMTVKPGGPAAKAGLQANDKIVAINTDKVSSYKELRTALKPLSNTEINVTVIRDNKTITIPVITGSKLNSSWRMTGYLGIKSPSAIWPPDKVKQIKYAPSLAMNYALQSAYQIFEFNLTVITKIITGIIPLTSLSGPIGFIKTSMQALNSNFTIFFETFAIFNILLAFVNLLPMPGLDGGNILFIIYEKIANKELSILWQELIIKCSFIFLAIITIHATMNDILRIID